MTSVDDGFPVASLAVSQALTTSGGAQPATLPEMLGDPGSIASVGVADPLHAAALTRYLQALDLAARADGARTGQDAEAFTIRTLQDVTLYGGLRPFLQKPDMDTDGAPDHPATRLEQLAAGDGPVLLRHDHGAAHVDYDPALVARMLLARQVFSLGGMQPISNGPYGPAGKAGKAAPGILRPHLWVEGPTLADTLTLSRPDGPAGRLNVTWPGGHRPGVPLPSTGAADTLSWVARAVKLTPRADGTLGRVRLANGVVFDADTPLGQVPFAVYLPDDKGVITPVRATNSGAALRLLRAWCAPNPGGLLERLRDQDIPARESLILRWVGMVSYQSRIDGIMDVRFPLPRVPVQDLRRFLTDVDRLRRALFGAVRGGVGAEQQFDVDKGVAGAATIIDPVWSGAVESAARDVATGDTSASQAIGELADVVAGLRADLAGARAHRRDLSFTTRMYRPDPTASSDEEPLPVMSPTRPDLPGPTSLEGGYVRRLAALHHNRDRRLAAARRWRPGVVDAAVIAVTDEAGPPGGLTDNQADAWATTAAGFAQFHAGRTRPSYGWGPDIREVPADSRAIVRGTSVAGAIRAFGAGSETATRRLDALLSAQSYDALHTAVLAALDLASKTNRTPHWATLAVDLTTWQDSALRDRLRGTWAHEFHTRPARTTGQDTDADADGAALDAEPAVP